MPVGRPRAFDTEEALDSALNVFWRKGYEGTSLPDLTEAMGINRPSLYAAFGNKEELFLKVLDRYASKCPTGQEAFREKTARGVLEKLLYGIVEAQRDGANPRGCLMINGAMACRDASESIRKELIARRAAGENALRERLHRAADEGDKSAGDNPAGLAGYFTAVMQGMAVQATSGATPEQLRMVAETALQVLP